MTNNVSIHRYFAACSPGIETLLEEELVEIGIVGECVPGGVTFQGPLDILWTIALKSRLAESLRLRLKPFLATSFEALETGFDRLPWHAYLAPNQPISVSVTCSESRLYHTAAVEERLLRIIDARAKNRQTNALSQIDIPSQKVFVRIVRNEVQVSIDASGELLHRRGYRTHIGRAPIRETLAAAALRKLTRHLTTSPPLNLWDPCCGSGTFLCEWLQDVQQIFPGFSAPTERKYAFERWPVHSEALYSNFRSKLNQKDAGNLNYDCRAYGSDRDPKTVESARFNLEQAQVLLNCELFCADFYRVAAQIPKDTAVISNLPYGVRLKRTNDRPSPWQVLDQLLASRQDLRPALVITTENPPKRAHNEWKSCIKFANGGLRVTAWGLPKAVTR
jgi:putative N6-adenine-specific DNA methylase